MPLYQQGSFAERYNFGHFLNSLELIGDAAEVGVHRGTFAHRFLFTWLGQRFYAIDHWKPGYDPDDPASQGDRQADYTEAMRVLGEFTPRVKVLQMSSEEASKEIADGQLGFVYLDACHRRKALLKDLRTWWPKVHPGGVLAGHDFLEIGGKWGAEVQPAVAAFADEHGLTVFLVVEPSLSAWSYYVMKPKRGEK